MRTCIKSLPQKFELKFSFVYADFPDEIRHRRKIQWPRMKKAREEGKTAFCNKSEPDKLFIDGELVPL